jgi:hypothetical protein
LDNSKAEEIPCIIFFLEKEHQYEINQIYVVDLWKIYEAFKIIRHPEIGSTMQLN